MFGGAELARRMNLNDGDVRDSFYTALLMHVGCVGVAHEAAAAFGDDLALNRAVARTNLGDPDDVVATFLPELTRGMPSDVAARATSLPLRRGRSGAAAPTSACARWLEKRPNGWACRTRRSRRSTTSMSPGWAAGYPMG